MRLRLKHFVTSEKSKVATTLYVPSVTKTIFSVDRSLMTPKTASSVRKAKERKIPMPRLLDCEFDDKNRLVAITVLHEGNFYHMHTQHSSYWVPNNSHKPVSWCCENCKTLGSPQWKRCPVCEAKMLTIPRKKK